MRLFAFSTFFAFLLSLSPAMALQFGDAAFAKKLCSAWNNSSLPKRLGEKGKDFGGIQGNGWIDFKTGESGAPEGYQKIVSGRRDCSSWPKFQLVLKKDDNGMAKCDVNESGAYDGSNLTWQFIPKTEHWFNLAKSFGMMDFMKLMNGFRGPMFFAKQNQGNFQIFWRLGARIGVNSDWQSGCQGIDVDSTQSEIDSYKRKFGIQ